MLDTFSLEEPRPSEFSLEVFCIRVLSLRITKLQPDELPQGAVFCRYHKASAAEAALSMERIHDLVSAIVAARTAQKIATH